MTDTPKTPREAVIEAMAKSLAKENGWPVWARLKDYLQRHYRNRATAALDALNAALPGLGLKVVEIAPETGSTYFWRSTVAAAPNPLERPVRDAGSD